MSYNMICDMCEGSGQLKKENQKSLRLDPPVIVYFCPNCNGTGDTDGTLELDSNDTGEDDYHRDWGD